MLEMKVMGIAIDTRTGAPIVVLHDLDNRKALPIWIGSAEASAIIRKIENISVTRPLTHDLIIDIIEKTGYEIDRVEINDVENDTYFADICLKDKNRENEIRIDSRPSDAIAVAIRADVPILIGTSVMAEGAISVNSQKEEEEAQEFKSFIQNIRPSDFGKILGQNNESEQ